MDVDKLLSALENEDNSSLLDLDFRKIKSIKNNILQKLNMSRDNLKRMDLHLIWVLAGIGCLMFLKDFSMISVKRFQIYMSLKN